MMFCPAADASRLACDLSLPSRGSDSDLRKENPVLSFFKCIAESSTVNCSMTLVAGARYIYGARISHESEYHVPRLRQQRDPNRFPYWLSGYHGFARVRHSFISSARGLGLARLSACWWL